MIKKGLFILFVLVITLNSLSARNLGDTLRYKNNVIKEICHFSHGLVVGERKQFDKKGELIETHRFNGNIGEIRSYYNDSLVASIISKVTQSVVDGNYTLTIDAGTEIYGFYKGTKNKKYSITVANTFSIDYKESYERYNLFFDDVILLYKRREMKGLEGSLVTYYATDGVKIISTLKIGEQDKGNYYQMINPENKAVLAHGYIKKVRSSDYYVGKWEFNYSDGILEKIEYFYDGEPSVKHIKYGTRIDTAYYYYQVSGKLKAKVHYPSPEDFNHRTDTLVTMYIDQQVRTRYDESKKAVIYKTAIKKNDEFEFSGLYEEFWPNGERKMRGYLCKPPRRQIPQSEYEQYGQINTSIIRFIEKPTQNAVYFQNDKMIKQIGMWYYFNEQGEIIDIKEYRLSGELAKEKDQPSKKEIDKENSKYKNQKESKFEFQYLIKDNE